MKRNFTILFLLTLLLVCGTTIAGHAKEASNTKGTFYVVVYSSDSEGLQHLLACVHKEIKERNFKIIAETTQYFAGNKMKGDGKKYSARVIFRGKYRPAQDYAGSFASCGHLGAFEVHFYYQDPSEDEWQKRTKEAILKFDSLTKAIKVADTKSGVDLFNLYKMLNNVKPGTEGFMETPIYIKLGSSIIIEIPEYHAPGPGAPLF